MPVDARIPLGVEPVQMPDFAQLAVQRASVMNSMAETAAKQRALREQNTLAQLVQTPGYDPTNPEWRRKTATMAPNLGSDFLKAQDDALTAQAAAQAAARAERDAQRKSAMSGLFSFTTTEEALADVDAKVAAGQLPAAQADAIKAAMKAAPSYEAFAFGLARRLMAEETPEKLLEQTTQNVDLGGTVVQQAFPKYGPGAPTGTLTKTMTPDQVADNARMASTDRATSQRPFMATDQNGNATFISPDGMRVISRFDSVGKPTGGVEKAEAARGDAYKQIAAAEKVVNELLLPDSTVDKAKGGGLTAAQSFLSGLMGMTTPEMEAQAKLGPIGYVLLQQVPRFEGPQSDKDTAAYKDAAGKLQDPMSTAPQKRAALQAIKELLTRQKAYLDANPQAGAAITGAPSGGNASSGVPQDVQDLLKKYGG